MLVIGLTVSGVYRTNCSYKTLSPFPVIFYVAMNVCRRFIDITNTRIDTFLIVDWPIVEVQQRIIFLQMNLFDHDNSAICSFLLARRVHDCKRRYK